MKYYSKEHYSKNEPKKPLINLEIIEKLSKDLNLPFEINMQDWPIEVVNSDYIEKYIKYYFKVEDEIKKYVLMQMILDSLERQEQKDTFLNYWDIVKKLLEKDFVIHKYSIWCYGYIEEQESKDEEFMKSLGLINWSEFLKEDFWELPKKYGLYRLTPFLSELWYKMLKRDGVQANGI
jgi:hypothetical protein